MKHFSVELSKLENHVRLCRRNLRSNKVKCCATCPFENIICEIYPDMKKLFERKRARL